jgi:hypothetical protein
MDRLERLVSTNVAAVGCYLSFLLLDVESIKSCPSHQRHTRTEIPANLGQYSRFGCLQRQYVFFFLILIAQVFEWENFETRFFANDDN